MPEGIFSPMHLLIVLVILIFLFGAKKLPELGKSLGSGIKEFKSGVSELHADATDEPPTPVASQPSAPESDATTQKSA
ncbi:MAG TPA: twin-arginine translocase TatA/TatE family subunit [Thermoleophilia bacterium]|nr:twin-arginine translocase TatA/TatE family subunit [Thermoleophilia bacterium]